jgi:hypothetical protein
MSTLRILSLGASLAALAALAACDQTASTGDQGATTEAAPAAAPESAPADAAPAEEAEPDETAAADTAETQTASADGAWTTPRTPWGDPDLRGTWPLQHLAVSVPLQRPPEFGDRLFKTEEEMGQGRIQPGADPDANYKREQEQNKLGMGAWVESGSANNRTSLIVSPANGRLPEYTEEGARRSALMRSGWVPNQTFDWVTDFDNWDRCITRSLPATMLPSFYNTGVRVWQAPGYVAIQTEMIHEVRVIPLDGRPAPDEKVQQWLGEPRGHWEGDTLVVVSKNFNGQGSSFNAHTITAPPYNNVPLSTDYTFTETFTRTGPDTLTYRATIDDPTIWKEPITLELPWVRDDSYELYEYACHEGNTIVPYYISASRAARGLDVGVIGADETATAAVQAQRQVMTLSEE